MIVLHLTGVELRRAVMRYVAEEYPDNFPALSGASVEIVHSAGCFGEDAEDLRVEVRQNTRPATSRE